MCENEDKPPIDRSEDAKMSLILDSMYPQRSPNRIEIETAYEENRLSWSALSRLCQSPISRSISLIPILGYLILYNEYLGEFINNPIFGPLLLFTLSTSIKLIYFGSILIAVAVVVYQIWCPPMIKSYPRMVAIDMEFVDYISPDRVIEIAQLYTSRPKLFKEHWYFGGLVAICQRILSDESIRKNTIPRDEVSVVFFSEEDINFTRQAKSYFTAKQDAVDEIKNSDGFNVEAQSSSHLLKIFLSIDLSYKSSLFESQMRNFASNMWTYLNESSRYARIITLLAFGIGCCLLASPALDTLLRVLLSEFGITMLNLG